MLWIVDVHDGKKMTELCALAGATEAGAGARWTIGLVNAVRRRFRTWRRPAAAAAARARSVRPAGSTAARIRRSDEPIGPDRPSSAPAGRTCNLAPIAASAGQDPAGKPGFPAYLRRPPVPFRDPAAAHSRTMRRTKAARPQGGARSARVLQDGRTSPGRASVSSAHIGCGCSHGAWAADQAGGSCSESLNRNLRIKVNASLLRAIACAHANSRDHVEWS